jgi:DNA polymerase-3 subunit epsilon
MELNLGKPIVFFDLETTGINVAKDRIVEIACIKIYPDGKEETLEQRINPEMHIPIETSEIHGIYDEDVRLKPTFKEFVNELLQFIGNADLAGYNSNRFDVPMLVEEILRVGADIDMKNRRMLDVQNIFMRMEQRTLSAAHKFYLNEELVDAHSALADTTATYKILKAQLDKYNGVEFKDRSGEVSTPVVNDINALSEFSSFNKNADLMGQIIFNENDEEVFNFGKYKGRLVSEVFEREPQYYEWMMKADFPSYTKKILTAIKLRSFNGGSSMIS